ncbi:hypothetical protein ATANTOWER_004763 [Ataeniobius toweri]|uniref:Fork-head domain-containing protein n=1 Tax=Ataeniobius toweri TaxID=208326 RepID=A0ABU7AF34_9TELE|nr:hypothetical protein [Ataeniobius toweri]
MEKRTEKFGTQLSYFDKPAARREFLKRGTTYLAKIALVLQDAPGKMLTFTQLMDKLAPPISEDGRSVKNNIRVCLSAYRCFVKIPVIPDSRDSKKNYWKLDCSQITAKMVRRHFTRHLKIFPELASKLKADCLTRPSEQISAIPSPEPAACSAVQVSRGSPLSSVQAWADQQQQQPRPKTQ